MSSEGVYGACVASIDAGWYSMTLYFSEEQMVEAQKMYVTPAPLAGLNKLCVKRPCNISTTCPAELVWGADSNRCLTT